MSINFPNADFAPNLSGYTGSGAFRFWCQKVLPIVYDDSLSYYELLNKVVDYLNHMIEDVRNLDSAYISLEGYVNDHFNELVNAYNELHSYLDDWIENKDLTVEVAHKIDNMVINGTFAEVLTPLIREYYTTLEGNLDDEIADRIIGDTALSARIDELIAPSGEAPNPAEIVDARVGENGYKYNTLGTAIRSQIEDINVHVAGQLESLNLNSLVWEKNKFVRTNGSYGGATEAQDKTPCLGCIEFIPVTAGTVISVDENYVFCVTYYDYSGTGYGTNSATFISQTELVNSVVIERTGYIRLYVRKADGSDIDATGFVGFIYDTQLSFGVSGNRYNNLYHNYEKYPRTVIDSNTGVRVKDKRPMITTDFLPVNQYSLIRISGYPINVGAGDITTAYTTVHGYDVGKNYVGRIRGVPWCDNGHINPLEMNVNIPAGVEFVIVTYPIVCGPSLKIEGYSASDFICRYKLEGMNRNINALETQKWCFDRPNEEIVKEVLDVAFSYKARHAYIRFPNEPGEPLQDRYIMMYGSNSCLNPTFNIGQRMIDCSTFIGLVLRGIRYEDTPYNLETYPWEEYAGIIYQHYNTAQYVANPKYKWSFNSSLYPYLLLPEVPDSIWYPDSRRAAQLANILADLGREVMRDDQLVNVVPGDLVFFAHKSADTNEYLEPLRFRHINHVVLITKVELADPDMYKDEDSWNFDKYPYAHHYIDVHGGTKHEEWRDIYDDPRDPVKTGIMEQLGDNVDDIYHNSMATIVGVFRPYYSGYQTPIPVDDTSEKPDGYFSYDSTGIYLTVNGEKKHISFD